MRKRSSGSGKESCAGRRSLRRPVAYFPGARLSPEVDRRGGVAVGGALAVRQRMRLRAVVNPDSTVGVSNSVRVAVVRTDSVVELEVVGKADRVVRAPVRFDGSGPDLSVGTVEGHPDGRGRGIDGIEEDIVVLPADDPRIGLGGGANVLPVADVTGRARLTGCLPDTIVEEDLVHGFRRADRTAVHGAARNAGAGDAIGVARTPSDIDVENEGERVADPNRRPVLARGVRQEIEPVGDRTEADGRLLIRR